MTETDRVFAGSIPALYDRYLGPLIFQPYADDLVERLADTKAGDLLEVAAGTGIVTRAMARRLAPEIRIVATDLNQPMIDFAASQTDAARVTWRQADALSLPFADASFDIVVCQFGVMFFPDKRAAFREARRVLRPGGRFIFNVWDRLEENEFPHTVTGAVAAMFPDDPPRFLARMPHGYHDTAVIRAELQSADFKHIDVETLARRSRTPSHRDPAVGFCQGTPLRNEIEARDASRLAEVTEAAADALAGRFAIGPIDGKIQAHVIAAVR
jgi:ubiquinone/menaquinone biosynthesis C-methylase UbiE